MSILGAAAILGGAGIVGSVLNSSSQSSANNTNIELARMQNEWNLAQWHRENEYNSPKNQMARLAEAGINPNLAYANGVSGNVSAQSPRAAPASVQPYTGYTQDLTSAVSNALSLVGQIDSHKMNAVQMDSQRLQQMTESAKRLEILARTQGLNINNQLQKETFDDLVKYQHNQQLLIGKQVSLSEAQYYTEIMKQVAIEAEAINKNANTNLLAGQLRKVEQEIQNLRSVNDQTKLQIARDKYEFELNKAGFSTKDPLYANLVRNMVDDPDFARMIILGLEGADKVSTIFSNAVGGVGKAIGNIFKGKQPTKIHNINN